MTRIIPFAALALLAACSSEPEQVAESDDLEAKGEILGGSISDDMLPLESVSSQSPQLADAPEPVSTPEPTPEPEADSAPEAPAAPAQPAPTAEADADS